MALSWKEIVQNYIAKFSDKIKKTTRPLRDHFGICYFTYHRIDQEGKYTVLVDRPDWAEHYVSQQFFLNDPFLRHPRVFQSGLCLVENQGSEEYKEAILKAGKNVLNADTGVMLIQKKDNEVEFFGFSGNHDTSCLQNLYLNQPQLLKSFARHFKKELGSILTHMENEAGSLIELKGCDFLCQQPICLDIPINIRRAFLKDLGLNIEQAAKLSSREKQCLKLFLEGKTAKETAFILSLSSRTVESYFENIKTKLSCWSKSEVWTIAKNLEDLQLL